MESVFIFGAGSRGESTFRHLDINDNYHVLGFIDNSPTKIGTTFMGKPVYPPEHLYSFDSSIRIIIASASYMAIVRQLAAMSFKNTIYAGTLLMQEEHGDKFPLFTENILNSTRSYSLTSDEKGREDLIIEAIFNALGVTIPKYLDIGAFYPKIQSNTYLFYEKGGAGKLVEPAPWLAQILRKERPNDEILELAVSDTPSEKGADFYLFKKAKGSNTIVPSNMEYWTNITKEAPEIIKVKIDTFNNIADKDTQFVSLDAEGKDLDIMKSIDYDAFPDLAVMCTETPNRYAIEYMQNCGFTLFYKNTINAIFVRNKFVPQIFEDKLCLEIFCWGKIANLLTDRKHPEWRD